MNHNKCRRFILKYEQFNMEIKRNSFDDKSTASCKFYSCIETLSTTRNRDFSSISRKNEKLKQENTQRESKTILVIL